MVEGRDFSHWNTREQVERECKKNEVGFVFLKASEGRALVDSKALKWAMTAQAHGKEIGFYHYCRPDLGNDPEEEAVHFCTTVGNICKKLGIKYVVMAIDWEGKSVGYEDWLERFIFKLDQMEVSKPVIYCSKSTLRKMGRFPGLDCGLWVAAPSDPAGCPYTTGPWNLWAIHQYGVVDGVDVNVFNGNITQFMRYQNYALYTTPDEDTDETHCCSCCRCCRE